MVPIEERCTATAPLRGVPAHMETHHCELPAAREHDWHRCACRHVWPAALT